MEQASCEVIVSKQKKWKTIIQPGEILYSVNDVPPPFTCIALGAQHLLTMVVGTISLCLLVMSKMCLENELSLKSDILSTTFFVMGIATLLQATVGVRLPIVQGATASILLPTLATLSMQDILPCDAVSPIGIDNQTIIFPWQQRLQRINGLIICSSAFQVVIGLIGLPSILVHFIGPLSIVPTITLIGLTLFKECNEFAQSQWWIAITTIALIGLFTFVFEPYNLPFPGFSWKNKKFYVVWVGLFRRCPVILAIVSAWLLCFILTISGAFPNKEGEWGYQARTDVKISVLQNSNWFMIPHPGRFGWPAPIATPILGFYAGVMASVFESVGDYYVTARVAKVPSPPTFAICRGIFIEGVGCFIAGLFGSPVATTSYSDNIGAISFTKVASRRVVQVTGLFCLLLGIFPKISAFFVSIPDPLIGGVYFAMFSLLCGIGLSSLQSVNLNSTRNCFVLGISLFAGLALPDWVQNNPKAINLGYPVLNDSINVLFRINMFVGGLVGFALDNLLPGSREDRGLAQWSNDENENSQAKIINFYESSVILRLIKRFPWLSYLPIFPRLQKQEINTEMEMNGFEIEIE